MRIEFVTKDGNLIADLELDSNPFKVGEEININVSNNDKSYWSVDEVNCDFKIEKIQHFLRKIYSSNNKLNILFAVSIEVSPINK